MNYFTKILYFLSILFLSFTSLQSARQDWNAGSTGRGPFKGRFVSGDGRCAYYRTPPLYRNGMFLHIHFTEVVEDSSRDHVAYIPEEQLEIRPPYGYGENQQPGPRFYYYGNSNDPSGRNWEFRSGPDDRGRRRLTREEFDRSVEYYYSPNDSRNGLRGNRRIPDVSSLLMEAWNDHQETTGAWEEFDDQSPLEYWNDNFPNVMIEEDNHSESNNTVIYYPPDHSGVIYGYRGSQHQFLDRNHNASPVRMWDVYDYVNQLEYHFTYSQFINFLSGTTSNGVQSDLASPNSNVISRNFEGGIWSIGISDLSSESINISRAAWIASLLIAAWRDRFNPYGARIGNGGGYGSGHDEL